MPHLTTASTISVNLGRNRTTASLVGNSGSMAPVLLDGKDGIVTRWVGNGDVRRITDHLIDLVDADLIDEAVALCRELASVIVPAGNTGTPTIISVPAAFGPICCSVVESGFAEHCIVEAIVPRPLSSIGSILGRFPQLSGGPSLVIDNDGGELSAIALDPKRQLAFHPTPLSTGPHDNPALVAGRLHSYLSDTSALLETEEIVVETDPETVGRLFGRVVLSGPGANETLLRDFVRRELPSSEILVHHDSRPSDEILALALAHQDWSAGWPTATISIAGGRLSILDANGVPYSLNVGTVSTSEIRIPNDLADSATFRTIGDGRLLVLGKPGTRPLAMRVGWPLTTGEAKTLNVTPIGTRPLEVIGSQATGQSVSASPG